MSERQVGIDVNQVEISSLKHIHGQPQVQDVLKISLEAYFQQRQNSNGQATFGPVMLTGPSGTGKTLTAKAIHCELGNLNLLETNGESVNCVGDIASLLLSADEHTTVFIDEAQSLNSRSQHLLLTALSERKLYIKNGKNKNKHQIPLSNFITILATTHEFQLQDALRNRMRIHCRFDYYSLESLTHIIKQKADALRWDYESEDVLSEIAKRSKSTPRIALNRNLQMAYNVCLSNNRDVITLEDVLQAFRLMDVDLVGLDALERKYLQALASHHSMKLNVIASLIGLPRKTITDIIEPYLLRIGFISKDGVNRIITDAGQKHIEKMVSNSCKRSE